MYKPHIFWERLVTHNQLYKHIKQETKEATSYRGIAAARD
jgi:hypothetical protein